MSRVKEIREQNKEKKLLQEYNKRKELAALRDKHNPEYSNWRGNVTEGMNTSNVFFTTLPSTGETDLESIDTDTTNSFEGAAGDAAFQHSEVVSSGSGSGSDGGFDIGNHLTFNGDGAPRWSILKPIDSSKFDTFVINAIRGNDNNGGEDPDEDGEELRLFYLPPGGSTFRSITRNQSNDLVLSADSDIIIPLGSTDDGLIDYSVTLPSYARGEGFAYMLYQQTNSGTGFDNYGVKSVRYKRRAPLSVFLPLDSPEAVSFINDGSGGLTPEEKKKRLDDMLAASDEYIGTAFPENKIISDRVKDQIQQTIASTDRQKFDDVQRAMTYDETLPEKTQIEAASASYRQELENKGLKPGEFGATDFYDWFKQQPNFVEPPSGEVNLKNFDPKSYQAGQKSAEVQFWSDPAKLASNEDIQNIFDPDDQLKVDLNSAINNVTSQGRIPNYGLNKEDDSYIDAPPAQKQMVYAWMQSRAPVALSGKARIGYYTDYPAEDYYAFLTTSNPYDWAESMMQKHLPNIKKGGAGSMDMVYHLHLQSFADTFDERGGGRYSDTSLATTYDDMIKGYHNLTRRLYAISNRKGKLTGAYAAEYNAIISSLSDFMQLINPGNITGKGALFGDTFADYYWGKVVPEPIDKTLPGFMFKVLDTEELVSNLSNSEQVELRRLASKFDKAENFVGYDPNADVDAYTTAGTAALNYSIPISKSILINRPIVIDPDTIPPQYVTTMALGLKPHLFMDTPGNPRTIPIVSSPVAYADDNIFVGSDGKVKSNIGPKGQLAYYKKNTTFQPFTKIGGINNVPVFGFGNALAAQGQAQYQMIVPKDGSEPYLYYMDHAYVNNNSTDPNEIPGNILGFNPKATISTAVHALRDLMQLSGDDTPNTGGMAGYPPGIRGDVITHVKIPMSKLSPDAQRMIRSEVIKMGLGGKETLEKDNISSDEIIDPVSGRLGSYGLDSTTAGTVRPNRRRNRNENYELKAKHNEKISKITGRLRSPDEFFSKDVKPVFPENQPPEMIDGRHPDLVDGEKISKRFDKLDPISAKAMPKTGNPKIDSKVLKALKKRK
tara:strand:- start:221 stop:3400 length:3180 start_codon:yes stop_codon:yes gene_type:complete